MTPSPGVLRWTALVTTGVVLIGGVGGYVLWHRLSWEDAPSLPAAAARGGGGVRRLDPPAGMDAREVERLRALVADCLASESADLRRTSRESLAQEGAAAVPFLLDAAARLATEGPGFADQAVVVRFRRIDRPLSAIRRQATPADPPPPWRPLADAAWAEARVAAWFAWWDARR